MKLVLSAILSLVCVQIIVPFVNAGNECPLHDTDRCCSSELKMQIKLLVKVAELLKGFTPIELLQLQQAQVIQMLNDEIEQLSQNEQALLTPALLEAMQKQHVIQLQEMQFEAIH